MIWLQILRHMCQLRTKVARSCRLYSSISTRVSTSYFKGAIEAKRHCTLSWLTSDQERINRMGDFTDSILGKHPQQRQNRTLGKLEL